ncbi:MAG: SBBP repeat-containing protein, partial [Acidobacteriota bacterium]
MALRKQVALGARVLLWLFLLELLPPGAALATATPSGNSGVVGQERVIERPLLFEENRSQAFGESGYLVRSGAFLTLLTPEKIIWILRERPGAAGAAIENRSFGRRRIQMECLGTSSTVHLSAEEPVSTRTTYLRGRRSSDARPLIDANYRRVRYEQVYHGIDLDFHGDRRVLEFDFELSPGADPTQIRMRFEGAESISVNPDGDLLLASNAGFLRHHAPRIFQRINGRHVAVGGRYRLEPNDIVSIEVDPGFDRGHDLIIDPVLGFSGYIGGSADDVPGAVAVDTEGNIYLAGSTGSTDFPLLNPLQGEFAGGGTPNGDAFVMKLDPSGSTIIYSTYIGGEGTDIARSIAVDSLGQAVITGTTFSDDFPSTAGSFQMNCPGQCPFVAKLSADGSEFVYSTFVGSGDGGAVAVDSAGQAVVTGKTTSNEFPIKNAFQENRAGGFEVFVSKLTADGSDLVFSTFLGGSGDENLTGRQDIAVDGSDNIYVVGRTPSSDFPTLQPVQSELRGGDDAFVAKLGSQGAIVYSTYLGGSQN